MLYEAAQAAAEAAKQAPTITVAIPTAVVTSVLTGLAVKLPDIISRMKGKPKNGNGSPKPGMGPDCLAHRDMLTEHETKFENLDKTLARYEGYFQTILGRLPK